MTPASKSGYNKSRCAFSWKYEAKFTSGYNRGPFVEIKTRKVFYTCSDGICVIECPCVKCGGGDTDNVVSVETLEDHNLYHQVPHGTCLFCLNLLKNIPVYHYKKSVCTGPFYAPRYILAKTYMFTHFYEINGNIKIDKLNCDSCDMKFKKVSHRKRHFLRVHYEAKFSCQDCGKKFTRYDTLLNHKDTVHSVNEPGFPCDKCKSTFTLKKNLKVHEQKFHSEDKIQPKNMPRL